MQRIIVSDGYGDRYTNRPLGMTTHAIERLRELGYAGSLRDIPRDSPELVKVVMELGERVAEHGASFTIVEIPDGVDWVIGLRDGSECVVEKHRVWP